MINTSSMSDKSNWLQHFPALGDLSAEAAQTLVAASSVVAMKAGNRIFGPGQAPENYFLLIDGTVRVQQVSEGGREIVLYRVTTGDSCPLTTACLMGYKGYPAEAIAETDVRALAVPRATFDEMIARSPEFRRFVFTAFSDRVTDLFRVIDEVAFARMDIRLAQKLLELGGASDQLDVTHQQLASELGSAREVVGRILSEFQRRGWITVSRGSITLSSRPAIEGLARSR